MCFLRPSLSSLDHNSTLYSLRIVRSHDPFCLCPLHLQFWSHRAEKPLWFWFIFTVLRKAKVTIPIPQVGNQGTERWSIQSHSVSQKTNWTEGKVRSPVYLSVRYPENQIAVLLKWMYVLWKKVVLRGISYSRFKSSLGNQEPQGKNQ